MEAKKPFSVTFGLKFVAVAAVVISCGSLVSCHSKNATPSANRGIPANEASQHIGKRATVYGKVYDVKLTRGGTVMLDLGGAYPNEVFSVVQFHGDYRKLAAFRGNKIYVTGTIKEYRGTPEIIISSTAQVSGKQP